MGPASDGLLPTGIRFDEWEPNRLVNAGFGIGRRSPFCEAPAGPFRQSTLASLTGLTPI
jgi:hypothetical protein